MQDAERYCTRCGTPADGGYSNAPYGNAGYTAQTYNSFAIAGFCLSLSALVLPYLGILTAVLGIIFSALAKNQIAERPELGIGLANAGLVIGIILLAVWFFVCLIFFGAFQALLWHL